MKVIIKLETSLIACQIKKYAKNIGQKNPMQSLTLINVMRFLNNGNGLGETYLSKPYIYMSLSRTYILVDELETYLRGVE